MNTRTVHPTRGVAVLLRKLLPTDGWYRGEKAKGAVLVEAADALAALPADPAVPQDAPAAAVEAAYAEPAEWVWTEAQENAVRACVRFYRDNAALAPTVYVRDALRLLHLDKD